MLYHLLVTLGDQHILSNLFRYISFRSAGAMATSLILSLYYGPRLITWLATRGAAQIIRTDGPQSHLAKAGTPTMGGILIVGSTVLATLLWADVTSRFTLTVVGVILATGLLGYVDDHLKVVRRCPRGLIGRYKVIGQTGIGLAVAGVLIWASPGMVPPTWTNVPFQAGGALPIWFPLFVPWVLFVVTGTSNAVNLTDGIDGLVAGLTGIAAATLALFAWVIGRVDMSEYLGLIYLPGAGELSIFCAALAGAALGFLWFNAHPAEVFMGDTGSLAIGAAIATVALLLRIELVLAILGGVFVMETLSVVLQVGHFKWTRARTGVGKRFFRMAPLHHHFEQIGWSENRVVVRMWILGVLFALVALAGLKVR